MKVKILRSCFAEGENHNVDDTPDLETQTAYMLIGSGKAEALDEKAADEKPARGKKGAE